MLSEIKISQKYIAAIQNNEYFVGYHKYWNPALKPGYSGTAVLSLSEPLSIEYGLSPFLNDKEGRIITAHYHRFALICVYTVNSGKMLKRLDYRINKWDECFRNYVFEMKKKCPVIICGDLNVAHKPIDINHPNIHQKHAGFTIDERSSFDKLLSAGFIDSFRKLYPNTIKYTFWNYSNNARVLNNGWRLDYALLSDISLLDNSIIIDDCYGSDHCPIMLTIQKSIIH